MPDETFSDNSAAACYELALDGRLAALAQYRREGDTVRLTHTEVQPGFEGRGVGSRLAARVFEDLRARRLRADPVCPFMAGFVQKHPEYADLLAARGV